jgi:hypothetical protein
MFYAPKHLNLVKNEHVLCAQAPEFGKFGDTLGTNPQNVGRFPNFWGPNP